MQRLNDLNICTIIRIWSKELIHFPAFKMKESLRVIELIEIPLHFSTSHDHRHPVSRGEQIEKNIHSSSQTLLSQREKSVSVIPLKLTSVREMIILAQYLFSQKITSS